MFRYRHVVERIPWRIVGGVAVATPVLAVAQGSFLLYDYRRNHGNAPFPNMPSRGLVIADHNRRQERELELSKRFQKRTFSTHRNDTSSNNPLRILVIGDSLAAGVGTSQSSSPVLPHSIAVHLSSALQGRTVVWTCVGVPGQSAASLVDQLAEEDRNHSNSNAASDLLLLERWNEWRVRQRIAAATRETQAWWQTRREVLQENETEESHESNRVKRWWEKTQRQARKDWESVKSIVRTTLLAKDEEAEDESHEQQKHERTLQMIKRRTTTTREPDVRMGNYDVAIVLTGLNDLKEGYLPFMFKKNKQRDTPANATTETLQEQLAQVLKALESKMRTILPTPSNAPPTTATSSDQQREEEEHQQRNGPLVVFPALPYQPTIFNRIAPLSWFLVPLLRKVDKNKQNLAEQFPDRVLYVEAPDQDALSHAEEDRDDPRQKIPVLLQLNDVRVDVQERIEKLMHQYYGPRAKEDAIEEWDDDDKTCHSRPSAVISVDGIHPSDLGYQAWGEHIAKSIIEEWKNREQQR